MKARILQEAAVRYFLEVVNTGSISDAAERLNVVPSAVSRQISRLESELGNALFIRQSRGMVPSQAGVLLAAYARRSLLDAEQVCAEIDALHSDAHFKIRVGCTQGFAADFLPQAMAHFRQDTPRVHFDLKVDTAAGVTQRVREGDIDVGLTFSLEPTQDIHVAFSAPSPILAVVAQGHTLTHQKEVSFRDLLNYPLALPGPNSTLRRLIDVYCSRMGLACNSVLCSETLETLLGFVLAGDAVAFSGELFIRKRLASGQLSALPVPELRASDRLIEVQTLARRQISPLLQSFIERLCVSLPEPGTTPPK